VRPYDRVRRSAPRLRVRGGVYRRYRPSFSVGRRPIPVAGSTTCSPSWVQAARTSPRQKPWRARCSEGRTAGSASGLGKRTSSNAGTAPQAHSTNPACARRVEPGCRPHRLLSFSRGRELVPSVLTVDPNTCLTASPPARRSGVSFQTSLTTAIASQRSACGSTVDVRRRGGV
jgi:hypothetical protein